MHEAVLTRTAFLLFLSALLCGEGDGQGVGVQDPVGRAEQKAPLSAHGSGFAGATEGLPMTVLPAISWWKLDTDANSINVAWKEAFDAADLNKDGKLRLKDVGFVFKAYLHGKGEDALDFRSVRRHLAGKDILRKCIIEGHSRLLGIWSSFGND